MITWIIAGLLTVWCLINRFSKDGRVEGQPLGMPRGTVRAFITLLIVTFPFSYLLVGEKIPGLITNAIFIVVAFYFETRKSSQDKLKETVNEIKNPEEAKELGKRIKKPLYLPKYSVRILLMTFLVAIITINALGPMVPFETTNTLVDLLIIIILFVIGGFFRAIKNYREKGKLKEQIESIDDYKSRSNSEIIEKLGKQELSWWEQKGKTVLSLLTLAAIITSLLFFTFDYDFKLLSLPFYEFSFRETLLLLISVYYGFRD